MLPELGFGGGGTTVTSTPPQPTLSQPVRALTISSTLPKPARRTILFGRFTLSSPGRPVRLRATGSSVASGSTYLSRFRRGKLLDHSEFRRVLGHWVTGVAVVSTRTPDGSPCGLTANAVASVSLDPPLVLACIERRSHTHDCIRSAGFFAISVLRQEQERLARRFAASDPSEKYEGVAFREERTGAPILEGALAWLDCRLWQAYPAGDHSIFVGEVLAADAGEGSPLLYYRGGYGRLTP